MIKILLCLFLILFYSGCEHGFLETNDLTMAKDAYLKHNIPLCERLLERYLKREQNSDKRWEAWDLLLKAININKHEARASLECLEAMLVEYENDESKLVTILEAMGKNYALLHHYKRAADAWSAYLDLGELSDQARVEGFRKLASTQFLQRHFEAGEDTLQQCIGLPIPDHDKIYCMLDLADVNMTLERWKEVVGFCQQILDSDPDKNVYGMACYLYGDALEQLGKKKEALKLFEKAKNIYPNPEVIENRILYLTNENLIK